VATSLHARGWRQGSLIAAEFPAVGLVRSRGDTVATDASASLWVVCTQDCDLNVFAVEQSAPIVELRAVEKKDPPTDWGIRSRRLRLTEELYIDTSGLRCFVSPEVLSEYAPASPVLAEDRTRAFKTWLGLRYDRPAVPEHLVDLAREVAKRFGSKGGRETAKGVHDVLMQIDDTKEPPHVALFAVITDDADRAAIDQWLGDTSIRIDTSLGVVARHQSGTKSETPLSLIEQSYAADLSQLTWGGESPTGAE